MKAKKLSVTYPEQVFAPIQYHSFRTGGITLEIELSDDEKIGDVVKKAMEGLSKLTEGQFEQCLADFLRRSAVASRRSR